MMNSEGQEMGFLENGRLLLSCCLALVGLAFGAPAAAQISFSVTLPQSATSEPVTGRLIVVTTRRAADGAPAPVEPRQSLGMNGQPAFGMDVENQTGRAACRERECEYGWISGERGLLTTNKIT